MRTKHQLIMDSRTDEVARLLLEKDPHPSYIPIETRRLLCREAGNKCAICGATDRELHIDHINPVSNGGTATYANLQVLCWYCNLAKSSHGLDPRSYRLGYVIPIRIRSEREINRQIIDRLDDERY